MLVGAQKGCKRALRAKPEDAEPINLQVTELKGCFANGIVYFA
jgi:hypothetical protein